VQMRTVTSIEDRIVFEHSDRRFDSIEGVATIGKDRIAGMKGAETPGFAGLDSVIGNIPRATVNDERRSHGGKG
ncbi:MAG: hypothetical protein WBW49_08065, partial [Candidatus Acidiferrum sp.]